MAEIKHCTTQINITVSSELVPTMRNILIASCVLLWQQGKVLGSIYCTCDKVVDFPKSGHICGF